MIQDFAVLVIGKDIGATILLGGFLVGTTLGILKCVAWFQKKIREQEATRYR